MSKDITLEDVRSAAAAARAVYEKELAKVAKLGGKFFAQQAKDLFEQNPALETFQWQQIDDQYNDETYEFAVLREACQLEINGLAYDDVNDYNWGTGQYILKPEHADIEPLFDEVEIFLEQFDEDDLRLMFGDYATITVDREGATIS